MSPYRRSRSRSTRQFEDETYRRRSRRQRRRAKTRHRRKLALLVAALVLVVAAIGAAGITGAAAIAPRCDLDRLRPVEIGQNSFVYAADGSLLGSIPAEKNRQPVKLNRISKWMRLSTIAIEDRRFYEHSGIDLEGIARALSKDIRAGKVVEGGSTLTQQLVRNLYVGNEVTFERKAIEACLAVRLNRKRSKDWILESYLNTVFYGSRAYGVHAAAQTYFSKPAWKLGLGEAALLAGLTQAPSVYDPFNNPRTALARRDQVLRAMLDQRKITQRQYQQAVGDREIRLRPSMLYTRIREPYFFSYVRPLLIAQYGANTVRSGGLRVYTTVERRFQQAARNAVLRTLPYPDDPAAAIVSINPANGAIRAMTAVTPGKRGNQFNLASQGRRQAGSTFKTFVLAAAIAEGVDPDSTTYTSRPFTYQPDPLSEPWEVSTYSHDYLGTVPISTATLSSDNTVFAQLTLDLGADKVAAMAHRRSLEPEDEGGRPRPLSRSGLGCDLAARYGLGLRHAGGRRHLLGADGDPQGRLAERNRGQGRGLGPAAAQARRRGLCCGRGHEDSRGEHRLRHRHERRRLLQPPRRGQDRHDGQAHRRLVLRLHTEPEHHGLDGISAGAGADGERPRDRGRRWHRPDHHLEPLHALDDREHARGRLP